MASFELDQDTIYQAYDRFVCADPDCAGLTAHRTGRTIDGHRLRELTTGDVKAWYAVMRAIPLTCECGRLEAILVHGIPTILPADLDSDTDHTADSAVDAANPSSTK